MNRMVLIVLVLIISPFAKTMTLNGEFKSSSQKKTGEGIYYTSKFSNKENQCVLTLNYTRYDNYLTIQCEKEYNGVISLECLEEVAEFKINGKKDNGYYGERIPRNWVDCKEFKVIFRD